MQRFSRYCSAPKGNFSTCKTKTCDGLRSRGFVGQAFCATAVDGHAQVNTQRGADSQSNAIKGELEVAAGRDVRVGIYTSIRADSSSGPLPSIRLTMDVLFSGGREEHQDFQITVLSRAAEGQRV